MKQDRKASIRPRRPVSTLVMRGCALAVVLAFAYFVARFAYWHQRVSLVSERPHGRFQNGTTFTEIHFQSDGSLILIPVLINGHPKECMLDTGTEMTHIPHRGAEVAEDLPAQLFGCVGTPVAGTSPRPISISRIKSVQIGDYRIENLPVRTYPMSSNDDWHLREPILGNDLFRDATITIDWPRGILTIASQTSNKAPANENDWDKAVDFQQRTQGGSPVNLIVLPATIAKSPGSLILDTGQFIEPLCIIDHSLAQRIANNQGSVLAAQVNIFDEDVAWSVAGSDFHTPAYTDLAMVQPFQGLIGTPFFLAYRVGIDYALHRLYLHKFRNDEYASPRIKKQRHLYFGN